MNIAPSPANHGANVRFSVCVPVWNDRIWLPRLLDSILAQNYAHLELIVGDNASSEEIGRVATRSGDPRVRYHRWDEHVDAYRNFNRTMGLAAGGWIVPIGADDLLAPNALRELAAAIEAAQAAGKSVVMAVAAARRVDPSGAPADRAYYGSQAIKRVAPGVHDAASWLRVGASPGAPPWNIGSVAFRRDAWEASGGFRPEVGLSADTELILRMGSYGPVVYIDRPIMDYTVRQESDGSTRFAQNRSSGEALTPTAAALLSALAAHEELRQVSTADRASLRAAAAASHLRRASQHRLLPGGRGWSGAASDLWTALRMSPGAMLRPRSLGIGFAALLAPKWMIRRASILLARRHDARVDRSP